MFDLRAHNRVAWDRRVERGNRWTLPMTSAEIAAARRGEWQVWLTGKPVPRHWFPDLRNCRVLCLAGGGGQQAPILAAAGALVTTLDFSPNQLAQDRFVAERDGLTLTTVQGDMADLSMFANESFDLVFHPVSNTYVPEIRPVWRETYRVLQRGGTLLAGFINPINFVFDDFQQRGDLVVKYSLPFSELTSISEAERQAIIDEGDTLQFSHTFDDQIGGQLEAGFLLAGFFEDRYTDNHPLVPYMPTHFATRALKP